MNLKKDVLIVGYGVETRLVTTNRSDAEKALDFWKEQYPVLNWGIRTIEEAMREAVEDAAAYYQGSR